MQESNVSQAEYQIENSNNNLIQITNTEHQAVLAIKLYLLRSDNGGLELSERLIITGVIILYVMAQF